MLKSIAVIIALAATGSVAAESAKAPWALSVEERVALRTDPALARERVRARNAKRGTVSPNAARIADSFDGKTHPELFLPHEVFRNLIQLAFLGVPSMGESVRKGFMAEVRQHALPADFWERLRVLSTIYLADATAVRDLLETKGKERSAERLERIEQRLQLEHRDSCRSRAAALAAARQEFGRERFDRFLYEVMATKMFSVSDKLIDPEVLRNAEEGCR